MESPQAPVSVSPLLRNEKGSIHSDLDDSGFVIANEDKKRGSIQVSIGDSWFASSKDGTECIQVPVSQESCGECNDNKRKGSIQVNIENSRCTVADEERRSSIEVMIMDCCGSVPQSDKRKGSVTVNIENAPSTSNEQRRSSIHVTILDPGLIIPTDNSKGNGSNQLALVECGYVYPKEASKPADLSESVDYSSFQSSGCKEVDHTLNDTSEMTTNDDPEDSECVFQKEDRPKLYKQQTFNESIYCDASDASDEERNDSVPVPLDNAVFTFPRKKGSVQVPLVDSGFIVPRFNRGREHRGSMFEHIPLRCEIRLSALSNPTDLDDVLFNLLADKDWRVPVNKFWSAIKSTGLRSSDPRLRECRQKFEEFQDKIGSQGEFWDFSLNREEFKECIGENIFLIGKAFKNDMVIPEFYNFTCHINEIFKKCRTNNQGQTATYIAQLARADPKKWGVSICTIDGQRHSFGDSNVPFCLQSCSKPLNYALAISDLGDVVHQYVGQEPSGRSFNELTLDQNHKPHNPMINAGAIVVTSLLKSGDQMADRFDYIFQQYTRMAGGEHVGFSNSTYLSERESSDRNFALGYYMRENKCFPPKTDLLQTLELYFQLCSVEVTAESGAVIAATLANGGICPISGQRVFAGEAVRNTLSLMYSCGMYDYSGQFAFKVGLPAKSGVSGCVLLVVPNVMGICTWSPPLDQLGNSCRGVQFCEELVSLFNFHNYDDLSRTERKLDPRKRKIDNEADCVVNLLFGASNGDVTAIRRFALSGMDMTACDYDGRTALHLAAAEGHLPVVKLLLEHCKVNPEPKDRWGFTPLSDAQRFEHHEVVEYLEDYIQDPSTNTYYSKRQKSKSFANISLDMRQMSMTEISPSSTSTPTAVNTSASTPDISVFKTCESAHAMKP